MPRKQEDDVGANMDEEEVVALGSRGHPVNNGSSTTKKTFHLLKRLRTRQYLFLNDTTKLIPSFGFTDVFFQL